MSDTTAHLAATILLLRDAEQGPEVFMVRRHHQIDFTPGALVFPGGRVDPQDAHPEVRARTPQSDNLTDSQCAMRAAAIREAFEESGLLLAQKANENASVSASESQRLAAYRKPLEQKKISFPEFLQKENLTLNASLLTPYAHWITPSGLPKRFDTHFFAARAPEGQIGVHDGRESVDSLWIRPADALDQAKAGKRQIIFPTRMNLALISHCESVQQILNETAKRPILPVQPEFGRKGKKAILSIDPRAGYPINEVDADTER